MSVGTICKVTGAIAILWFVGAFEFMPKLMADIGQWDGVDSIGKIMQSGGRAISSQWEKKIGNAQPLPANQNLKLGSEICKEGTVTANARLPQKEYEKHLQAVELKVRSPLRNRNPYMFCEWKDNKWTPITKVAKLVYIPEWDAATGKALIVDMDTESTQVIDLNNGQQSNP